MDYCGGMYHLLISWAVLTLGFWVAATLLPGVVIPRVKDAILVAALFGVLNTALGLALFTLIGIGTLGLGFLLAFITRWVVDALVLKLTDALTHRLTIRGFGSALLCALIMSAVGTVSQMVLVGNHMQGF